MSSDPGDEEERVDLNDTAGRTERRELKFR